VTTTSDRLALTGTMVDPVDQTAEAPATPEVVRPPSERARRRKAKLARWGRRSVFPILAIIIWQILSMTHVITEKELASPVSIAETFWDLLSNGTLLKDLWVSLERALVGLVFGVSIGVVLGVVAGLWRIGEDLIDASVQMVRTIPFLALVPLVVIWFGLGQVPKYFLVALAAMCPMYLGVFSGIRNVDVKLVEAAKTLGLNSWGLIRHVVLPGALPSALGGLRYALSFSVMALVIAEQINATSGIGYMILNAQQFLETNVIVVGLIIYALLGLTGDAFVRFLERTLLSWRRNFEGS
jgi:sulfonate transport system permease protein